MNINPETMVHDGMYNVKCKQQDNLYKPVMFESLMQIRDSHAMFEVLSFVDFRLYLKSFHSLERYIR